MQLTRILTIVMALLSVASCASLLNSRYQEVNISTLPPDAYVYVDGWIAKTPTKLTIDAKTKSILVKKKGYREKEITMEKNTRYKHVYLGNLFWFSIYPFAVYSDYANGAAYEIKKDINIDLEME